jgi:hypothetical protein
MISIIFLIIIDILLTWLTAKYFILEGEREGYFWDYKIKSNSVDYINHHTTFVLQRSIFFIISFGIKLSITSNILCSILFCVGLFLIHPYYHCGMMYKVRNRLNDKIYLLGWKSNSSKTSEALTDKMSILTKYSSRLNSLKFGLILIITNILIYVFTTN